MTTTTKNSKVRSTDNERETMTYTVTITHKTTAMTMHGADSMHEVIKVLAEIASDPALVGISILRGTELVPLEEVMSAVRHPARQAYLRNLLESL